MKIFENKNIFKKIVIVLLVVLVASFCFSGKVQADDGIGGKLLNPVMSLFVALGDGTMTLIQDAMLNLDISLIPINDDSGFWAKFWVVLTSAVIVTGIIAATVLTVGAAGGVVAAVVAFVKGTTAIIITVGVTSVTFPITTPIVESMLPDEFQLPVFQITPQEIFSNKIPLLDVDFFNPSTTTVVNTKTEEVESKTLKAEFENAGFKSLSDTKKITLDTGEIQYRWDYLERSYCLRMTDSSGSMPNWYFGWWVTGNTDKDAKTEEYIGSAWEENVDELLYEIKTDTKEVTEKTEVKSIAAELQKTISTWYNVLRDIAVVALLSILVYVGIRIVISSTSNDKAKYKQMLIDWIVAMCLLFVMQYIMSFSNLIVGKIIDIVDTTKISVDEENTVIQPEVFKITDQQKVKKAYDVLIGENGDSSNPYYSFFVDENGNTRGENSTVLVWPAGNFMEQARLKLQFLEDDEPTYVSIGWKLIYVVLVVLTIIFLFTYVKRVVYMAFLTIIAPLVAMTYPIDKMSDGKAQAFNMWFKEYIFNLLIQPMHLLLYTILIGSAMDFASKNIVYVVVALGFMIPAEKILRSFFGFEKAKTPGLLAGPAGAAVMMSGINKLLGKGPRHSKEPSKIGGSGSQNNEKGLRSNKNFQKEDYLFNDMEQFKNNPEQREKSDTDVMDKVVAESGDHNTLIGKGEDENKDNNFSDNDIKDNTPDSIDDMSSLNINSDLDGSNDLDVNNDSDINSDLQDSDKIDFAEENDLGAGDNGEFFDEYDLSQYAIQNENEDDINEDDIDDEKTDDTPKKESKFLRAMKATSGYAANRTAERLKGKMDNFHPVGMVKGAAGGLVMGTAGLIAGIASGDVSKGFQYTAAGAVGGYKVARGNPQNSSTINSLSEAENVFKRAYHGDDEYEKRQREKAAKNFRKNQNNKFELNQAFNDKAKVDKIMEKDIPVLIDNGVTDIKDIIAIEKMKDAGQITRIEEGITIKKNASRLGNVDTSRNWGKKNRDDWKKKFAQEYASKSKYSGYNHDMMAEDTMKKIDEFNKIRFS